MIEHGRQGDRGARPETNQDLRGALRGAADAVQGRTWLGGELTIDSEDPHAYPGVTADFTADPQCHLAVLGAGAEAAASKTTRTASARYLMATLRLPGRQSMTIAFCKPIITDSL